MENKELVRLGFERGCNQRDTEGAAELISEDYMLHDPSMPDFPGGREAFKELCSGFMEAIRDASCTIEDQIEEGDKVVTRFTFSGCQQKDLPEIPSNGRCFKVSGVTISRVADGRIAEEWMVMDELGMRRQLGGS